jgi:hypothetical protein
MEIRRDEWKSSRKEVTERYIEHAAVTKAQGIIFTGLAA